MVTSFKINDELKGRIKNLLVGTETVSQFAAKATEEKVTRMESRNERARLQMLKKNSELLKPIIKEIFSNPEFKEYLIELIHQP